FLSLALRHATREFAARPHVPLILKVENRGLRPVIHLSLVGVSAREAARHGDTNFQQRDYYNVSVRAMEEADLNEARRIFRLAFATFLGVPEPETFRADREYVFTSWRTEGGAALVAEANGNLAGSNFATQWGSFGFFGPLTIRPEFWDQRIAQRLLGPTMDL